jgi:hypothetical protein
MSKSAMVLRRPRQTNRMKRPNTLLQLLLRHEPRIQSMLKSIQDSKSGNTKLARTNNNDVSHFAATSC